MENEMLLELRKKDDEYAKAHESFYAMQEQPPFILEVMGETEVLPLPQRSMRSF